jgi:hypothetical protein
MAVWAFASEKPSMSKLSCPTGVQPGIVQRCGGRTCPTSSCTHGRSERAYARHGGVGPGSHLDAVVQKGMQAGGQPLDTTIRTQMESYFGHDFSHVRIHTDDRAAESADAMNSMAYTVGGNIIFRRGQYLPGSRNGQELIAHELAHVLQQRSVGLTSGLRLGPADHPLEEEATAVAAGFPHSQYRRRSPVDARGVHAIQRISFGKDGDLPSDLKSTVQAAARIAERHIMSRLFEEQWNSTMKSWGGRITPQPTLEAYRNAVKGRVVHDMDTSTDPTIAKFLEDEAALPLERQTGAVTRVGSRDTYIRRFAIQQGVDSVVSLLLHESLHGAGLGMGPLEVWEPIFHGFEASVGYPMMMGGGRIDSTRQRRLGDTGVEVTVKYSLHKIDLPLPAAVELQVAEGDSANIVFRRPLPRRVGSQTVVWRAENPGWNSYSIRIIDVTTGSVMAAERIETNPRCVLGVSTRHCEDD